MLRITVQARQLRAGDRFSPRHHDLFQGAVVTTEANGSTVHVTTDTNQTGFRLDLNHAVTVYRDT